MESDLLKAAEHGDMAGARRALLQNRDSIHDLDSRSEMNALQLALVEFHHDMASFLLEKTEISARHKDRQGRDALHLGLLFAQNNDGLVCALNERWSAERYQELQAENVTVVPVVPFHIVKNFP